jgi:hypothetical protein
VLAGTPEYMAPEQARGEALDHRADLFSLGSVLYAMAAGVSPFQQTTTVAVLQRVSAVAVTPLRALNPRVPAWLDAFIQRLLAKEPADRFQSAEEVATLLAGYLAHLRQPTTVPAPRLPAGRSSDSAVTTGPRGSRIWPRLWLPMLGILGLSLLFFFSARQSFSADFSTLEDGAVLRSPWTDAGRSFRSQGGALVVVTPFAGKATVDGLSMRNADIEAYVRVPLVAGAQGQFVGVTARGNGKNHYSGGLSSTNGVFYASVIRVLDGESRTLACVPGLSAGSGTVRLVVIGTALELFVDGVRKISLTDTALTEAGTVGIHGAPGTSFTRFSAQPAPKTALPFRADFTVLNPGGQLGPPWLDAKNSYAAQDGVLRAGAPGASLATLYGPEVADVTLDTEVTVPPQEQGRPDLFAGVAARASDDNLYWGGVRSAQGNRFATIMRKVNGEWLPSHSAPITPARNHIGVRFKVSGSRLQLFIDGVLTLDLTDEALPDPGTVGLYATQGSTYKNFSAIE